MWGNLERNTYFWKFFKNRKMFSGTTNARLDAKGRVFMPSEFRKQLPESDGRLVLKRDAYQPCIAIYPYTAWEAEVSSLRRLLCRWDTRQAMVFRQFMADAEVVTLDANGRLLVPKRLLEFCGMEKGVTFIGADDRIELWSAEKTAQPFLTPEEMAEIMRSATQQNKG